MATRTLGMVVASIWLGSDLLYLGWLCAQVLGDRRAAMAAKALQPWVSTRAPAEGFVGGSLDLAEANMWWRHLQRANIVADRACCSTEDAERTVMLEGLGLGA